MAELTGDQAPISAWVQLAAVAWLRWRIFVNGFTMRRTKTSRKIVSTIFGILLRLIVWPTFLMFAIGPVALSGFTAWEAIESGRIYRLPALLGGITLMWLFVSVNGQSISSAISSFDPASLVRYPLRFGRYFILRMAFGFLSPSTMIGCLALLAVAVGIGWAKPALTSAAVVVLAIYAWMNIFLVRMIGAWLERWLSNRRFREFFGVLMVLVVAGVQYFNVQRGPSNLHGPRGSMMLLLMHGNGNFLQWLPPGFAVDAILQHDHFFPFATSIAALLGFCALFAAVFALRLHKQFLGELLSEGLSLRAPSIPAARMRATVQTKADTSSSTSTRVAFPPVIATCLRKDLLTLRGNSSQLIGMFTPLMFVFIFSRRASSFETKYLLPGAIAYVLVGVLANMYNIFGADGPGVQMYLLAPVRLRDVIVAKNLMIVSVIVMVVSVTWGLISLTSPITIPWSTHVATLLWAIFAVGANLALGTLQSIRSPRRFVPGKVPQRGASPVSRTSSLLVLALLMLSLSVQFPVILLSRFFHQPWLPVWIYGPMAIAAVTSYAIVLGKAERLILTHRDTFVQELCKP
jgi:ABC-2 type transport system permease protein